MTWAEFVTALTTVIVRPTTAIVPHNLFPTVANQIQHPVPMVDPYDPSRVLLFWHGCTVSGQQDGAYVYLSYAAASSDLSLPGSWTHCPNPIFSDADVEAGGWSNHFMGMNTVVWNPATEVFHLYYWGTATDYYHRQIGVATFPYSVVTTAIAGGTPAAPTRYAGNPIIRPLNGWGVSGEYDIEGGDFWLEGGNWYAYVCVGDGPTRNGGAYKLYTSTDGYTFTRTGTTVISAGPQTYDDLNYEWNSIFKLPGSGLFGLVYEGRGSQSSPYEWSINIAGPSASLTAGSWTKDASNSVYRRDGTGIDANHVGTPRLFTVNNVDWYLFYQAIVTDGYNMDLAVAKFAVAGEPAVATTTATAGTSIRGASTAATSGSVTLQRQVQVAVWAEDGGEVSDEVTRDYLIAVGETRNAAASASIRGALTATATGSASVQGAPTASATGSVPVAQARTAGAAGSASLTGAATASTTASSVLAAGATTASSTASTSIRETLALEATASTSIATRTTTTSTAALAFQAGASAAATASAYVDQAGPSVTSGANASASVTDALAHAVSGSATVALAGERSATPSVALFGDASTSSTGSATFTGDLTGTVAGSVVVALDGATSAAGSIEIAPAASATASVIIGSPFQPSRSVVRFYQSPVVELSASPALRLVEGVVRNGFKLEVPHSTNFAQTVEFFQPDRTTPRDVSAYTVELVVDADSGGAAGFTVTAANGSASHQKVFTFTAAQLVRMRRSARVTINAGGEAGAEDAASGTFIAA